MAWILSVTVLTYFFSSHSVLEAIEATVRDLRPYWPILGPAPEEAETGAAALDLLADMVAKSMLFVSRLEDGVLAQFDSVFPPLSLTAEALTLQSASQPSPK